MIRVGHLHGGKNTLARIEGGFICEFCWHDRPLSSWFRLSLPKPPIAFWPIPFFSVAFVSKIRSGPKQKGKIGKIWVWPPSSYKCRTGNSGVSGNERSVEAIGNIILRGKSETGHKPAYFTNLHWLSPKLDSMSRFWGYRGTPWPREQNWEKKAREGIFQEVGREPIVISVREPRKGVHCTKGQWCHMSRGCLRGRLWVW